MKVSYSKILLLYFYRLANCRIDLRIYVAPSSTYRFPSMMARASNYEGGERAGKRWGYGGWSAGIRRIKYHWDEDQSQGQTAQANNYTLTVFGIQRTIDVAKQLGCPSLPWSNYPRTNILLVRINRVQGTITDHGQRCRLDHRTSVRKRQTYSHINSDP